MNNLWRLRKNIDIIIIIPDKGKGVVILDRKLCDNAIQEIISDIYKFEKLNEDPTWNVKLNYHVIYVSWNKKNSFNEIEYDKLYPFGSAPARIYGTPKMHKISSSNSFLKLRSIVSSIGTFNYNLTSFLCDLLSPLVHNNYSFKDTFSSVSLLFCKSFQKMFCFLNHWYSNKFHFQS